MLVAASMIAAACTGGSAVSPASAGATFPTVVPAPSPAFSWAIYNRTTVTVAIGPALGLPPCSAREFAPSEVPGPGATIVPGAVPLAVAVHVPPDYTGLVSVVVTSDGTRVGLMPVDPSGLPPCAGYPRS